MSKTFTKPTEIPDERAFLVGIELRRENSLLSIEDSLTELELLASTAGLEVVGEISQKLVAPNSDTYIGSGKVNELKIFVEETQADVVIFDNELSPRHLRELEKIFGITVKIIDRTTLILDIFAQHAQTREGKLQVELAQYEYLLPRLTRAWTHLARQTGGGGGRTGRSGGVGLRGPGETQLEVDRRDIRRRISKLNSDIEKVRSHRMRHRINRKRTKIPIVALVGYTNAGKSTLLNRVSNSNVFVANKLFATLDPTTRRIELPSGRHALLTDTVGFIQKLPTQLIAAFRATLEEIAEADLLIHIVDITHPIPLAQWQSVNQTLFEIGADHIPVITVLNKIDRLPSPGLAIEVLERYPNSVAISALTGEGSKELFSVVDNLLYNQFIPISVNLPYTQGQLIHSFHEYGIVERVEHTRDTILIKGQIPGRLIAQFKPHMEDEINEV